MPDRYEPAWNELRRRRRQFLLFILFPIVIGAAWQLLHLPNLPVLPQFALVVLVVVWGALFILLWHRYFHWPCPNCSQSFQRSGASFLPLAYFVPRRRCSHCGYKMSGMPI